MAQVLIVWGIDRFQVSNCIQELAQEFQYFEIIHNVLENNEVLPEIYIKRCALMVNTSQVREIFPGIFQFFSSMETILKIVTSVTLF